MKQRGWVYRGSRAEPRLITTHTHLSMQPPHTPHHRWTSPSPPTRASSPPASCSSGWRPCPRCGPSSSSSSTSWCVRVRGLWPTHLTNMRASTVNSTPSSAGPFTHLASTCFNSPVVNSLLLLSRHPTGATGPERDLLRRVRLVFAAAHAHLLPPAPAQGGGAGTDAFARSSACVYTCLDIG